jgi:hypothetical protein
MSGNGCVERAPLANARPKATESTGPPSKEHVYTMCFGYNSCMVALTKKSPNLPQRPLRVRAQNHRYRLGAEPCSKSNSQANLREATYAECDRLESCSKDPIGFSDGENLYRAYFIPQAMDPLGKLMQIDVRKVAPIKLKGKCGTALYASWRFRLPANHKTKGWLVQMVIVNCAVGDCDFVPEVIRETTCGPENSPAMCVCHTGQWKQFRYYEAWRVGFNQVIPDNPPGMPSTPHDDTASYSSIPNTCGDIVQGGTLRFYADSDTGDLSTNQDWVPKPNGFGHDTRCPTSAKQLYAFDGKNGPPDFWQNGNPIASGKRAFTMDWKCCQCDPASKRFSEAEAFPEGEK